MRRTRYAVVVLCATVVLLVGLKSVPVARLLGWSAAAEVPVDPGGDAPGDGGATVTGTVDPTQEPAAPSQPVPADTPTAPDPGTEAAPPAPVSLTVAGAPIAVRTAQSPTPESSPCRQCADYSVSVTLTIVDGQITGTSVAYNPSPRESQSYASSADNKLRQSILSAQTWNLGRVSGATYSANAWELSARDAMAQAGLPV